MLAEELEVEWARRVRETLDASGVFPSPPAAPARPVSAIAHSGLTVHTYADGSQDWRIGGTAAWRNNNPGNLDFAPKKPAGAIGTYFDPPNTFAIFPDAETGMKALGDVLRTTYATSTIDAVTQRYAPGMDPRNNPEAYADFLAHSLGVSGQTRIGDLNPTQFATLMTAIKTQEGSITGHTFHIGAPGLPTLENPGK